MSRLAMFETDFVSSDGLSEMRGSPFDRSCAEYPLFEYAATYWPTHCDFAKIDLESVFIAQNEHLCGTPYQGSFSNIEPYLRFWNGQAGYEDVFQGRVRSELQAIALHILSNARGGLNATDRAGKTILSLAMISRSLRLAIILKLRKVPMDAPEGDFFTDLAIGSLRKSDVKFTTMQRVLASCLMTILQ